MIYDDKYFGIKIGHPNPAVRYEENALVASRLSPCTGGYPITLEMSKPCNKFYSPNKASVEFS